MAEEAHQPYAHCPSPVTLHQAESLLEEEEGLPVLKKARLERKFDGPAVSIFSETQRNAEASPAGKTQEIKLDAPTICPKEKLMSPS